MAVSGVAQVIAPEYITFIVLIFVNAFGTAGVYPLAFILGAKIIGSTAGVLITFFRCGNGGKEQKGNNWNSSQLFLRSGRGFGSIICLDFQRLEKSTANCFCTLYGVYSLLLVN